jgi:adenylate kinase
MRAKMRRRGVGLWMKTRYAYSSKHSHSKNIHQLRITNISNPQLLDHLESLPLASTGGYILDWHACDLFPERWIDLVIVLRCDSTLLYDRLTARGYKGKKLEENMDSEIMQVLLDEARESYKEEIVVELRSESNEDVEGNLERVEQWIAQWRKDRQEGDE